MFRESRFHRTDAKRGGGMALSLLSAVPTSGANCLFKGTKLDHRGQFGGKGGKIRSQQLP